MRNPRYNRLSGARYASALSAPSFTDNSDKRRHQKVVDDIYQFMGRFTDFSGDFAGEGEYSGSRSWIMSLKRDWRTTYEDILKALSDMRDIGRLPESFDRLVEEEYVKAGGDYEVDLDTTREYLTDYKLNRQIRSTVLQKLAWLIYNSKPKKLRPL